MNMTGSLTPPLPFGGINLRDFGVVGNGVANDGPAINAAIATLAARGGGVLGFPAGRTYLTTTRILCADSVSLVGEEMHYTLIKAGAGITTAVIVGLGATTFSRARIANLTIDGGDDVVTGNVSGLQVSNGSDILVEYVRFQNIRDIGVNFLAVQKSTIQFCEFEDIGQGGTNGHGIQAAGGCHGLSVYRNKLWTRSVEGMGIRIGNDGDGSLDCDISHNYVDQTGSQGLECIGVTPGCDRSKVVENTAINGRDNGISCSAGSMVITGNHSVGANFHGIQSNGNNSVLSANVCWNNNQVGDGNTRGGIHLNNTTGNVVTGNRCYDDQSVKTQDYGVKGSGAEGVNLIEANILIGNKTAETGNLNAAVVIRGNPGTN